MESGIKSRLTRLRPSQAGFVSFLIQKLNSFCLLYLSLTSHSNPKVVERKRSSNRSSSGRHRPELPRWRTSNIAQAVAQFGYSMNAIAAVRCPRCESRPAASRDSRVSCDARVRHPRTSRTDKRTRRQTRNLKQRSPI